MAARKSGRKTPVRGAKARMAAAHAAYGRAIDDGFGNCDMSELICAGLRAGVETLRRPDGYLRKDEMITFLCEYAADWEFSSTAREGVKYDDDLAPGDLGEACKDVEISEEILLTCTYPESVIEDCIGSIEGLATMSNFASAGMGGGGVTGYSAVKRGEWFAVYYDGDGEAGECRFWMEGKQALREDLGFAAAAKSANEALGLYDWFDARDPDDAYLVAVFADNDFKFNLSEALTTGDERSGFDGSFYEEIAEMLGLESEEEIDKMHDLLAVPSDAVTPEERTMVWKVWDECRSFYPGDCE